MDKGLIHDRYREIINLNLISAAVEHNPRELKRFLNNFIIAYEIFSSNREFQTKRVVTDTSNANKVAPTL